MRIFVDPVDLVAGELIVRGDEHHYLGRVRRARVGDAVELVDGAGRRAPATIAGIADAETRLDVGEPQTITARPPRIAALVPLIKGDRMDLCIEKLVEVGVDSIVVWPAARSVVKLDPAKRDSRLVKFRSLVQAAARQSGRAQLPLVTLAPGLAEAVAAHSGLRLVLDPASDAGLDPGTATEVTIVSGPEGGLSMDELELLGRAGYLAVGLGPRVLRAETSPTIAVALIRAVTRS